MDKQVREIIAAIREKPWLAKYILKQFSQEVVDQVKKELKNGNN